MLLLNPASKMDVWLSHVATILVLISLSNAQNDGSSMTTPTPFSFLPRQYNNVKETPFDYPDLNAIDTDFPTNDIDSGSPAESVMYVEKGNYDDEPNKKDDDTGNQPLPFDTDRYSQFGGFGSAELYRLLALGPQQSDPAIGIRYSGLFNRLSPKMRNPVENLDHCPDRPEIGIQYYCMQLEDGLYFDPWNPWCGYIECSDGVAERICCKQGTWLGPMMMFKSAFKTNLEDLCRRPILVTIKNAKCPMPSTKDICKAAIKVERMNPPKKKTEIPINQFSQGDLGRFSRIKTAAAPEPAPSSGRRAAPVDTSSSNNNGNDGDKTV